MKAINLKKGDAIVLEDGIVYEIVAIEKTALQVIVALQVYDHAYAESRQVFCAIEEVELFHRPVCQA